MPSQNLPNLLSILQEIRGEDEAPSRLEEPQHEIDAFRIEEPTLAVLPLRPGIGKVNVDCLCKALRQRSCQKIESFPAHRHQVGKPPATPSLHEKTAILRNDLDPQEASSRLRRCLLKEVLSLAKAQLDLPRPWARNESIQVRGSTQAIQVSIRIRSRDQYWLQHDAFLESQFLENGLLEDQL